MKKCIHTSLIPFFPLNGSEKTSQENGRQHVKI